MITETLRSMEKRMSWTNGRKMLALAGISPSVGWQRTIEKYSGDDKALPVGELQDALTEHNLCGDKFTKLYRFNEDARDRLYAFFTQCEVTESKATEAFPNTVSDDELDELGSDFEIVNVTSNEDGIGMVLSSVFTYTKRESIEFSVFDEPSEMRNKYEEVVGLKNVRTQLLHVIWLPHHRDYLEIRVDYPKGMKEVEAHGFHSILKRKVNDWGIVALERPINLFPAVRALYDDEDEGTVTEITFATPTSAIKNEKMLRRNRQYLDQRKEVYHLAGKKGLGDDAEIIVYKVTVEWPRPEEGIDYVPSVALSASGPSGNGPGNMPTISGASIANCIRAADYEFVIERLGEKAKLEELAGH
ncbi:MULTISPECIES: hypothetical protein [Sulfitobacter]|uniref:Uncharacterized protein n=1 Tax=Sulfitobacter profundi TaxID=2679961 RepID=A0ABW1Z251_9RHOB|nr:hypothetical protein [Sulfitobacter indolifex]